METLHGLDVAPNLCKFPFTVLCAIAAEWVVCRFVTGGAHFAPIQGLRFHPFHLLGFHFICTLQWCKHCNGLDGAPNLRKYSIHGAERNCSRGDSLQVRHIWFAFCSDPGFAFLGSPSP